MAKQATKSVTVTSIFYNSEGEPITDNGDIAREYRSLASVIGGGDVDLSHLSDARIIELATSIPGDGAANDGAIDKARAAVILAEQPDESEEEDYVPGRASDATALGRMASKELNEDLVKYADAKETLSGAPLIIAFDFAHNPNYQNDETNNVRNKLDALPFPGSRYDDDEVEAAKKKGITIETDYYQYIGDDGKKKIGQRWREFVEGTERGGVIADVIRLLKLLKEGHADFKEWDKLMRLTGNEETRETLGLGKGQVGGAVNRWTTRLLTMTNRVRTGEKLRRQCDAIDDMAAVTWNYVITDRHDKKTTLETLRRDAKRPMPLKLNNVPPVDKKTGKQKGQTQESDAMSVGSFINLRLDVAKRNGGTFDAVMATKVRQRKGSGNKQTTLPQSPTGGQAEEMITALHNVFSARGKSYADLGVAFHASTAKAERKTLGELVGMMQDFFAPLVDLWTKERIAEKEAADKVKQLATKEQKAG